MADMIDTGLKMWGDARDAATEMFFFNTYGSTILQAMVGLRADKTSVRRRPSRRSSRRMHRSRRTARGGRARADLCPFAGREGRRARVCRDEADRRRVAAGRARRYYSVQGDRQSAVSDSAAGLRTGNRSIAETAAG